MTQFLIEKITRNNAVWCQTICTLHNIPGTFLDTMWLNKNKTPLYYPNVVTTKNMNVHELNDASNIFKKIQLKNVTIKDSYSQLTLGKNGFSVLFEADWICYEADSHADPILNFKKILTEEELTVWERAWNNHQVPQERTFLPNLLKDPNVVLFAQYENNEIVSGFITNKSDDVIGLSNVFDNRPDKSTFWSDTINVIRAEFSEGLIVGYERGKNLQIAQKAGFKTVGKLKVWKKINSSALTL